jgi:hypothetical protein
MIFYNIFTIKEKVRMELICEKNAIILFYIEITENFSFLIMYATVQKKLSFVKII